MYKYEGEVEAQSCLITCIGGDANTSVERPSQLGLASGLTSASPPALCMNPSFSASSTRSHIAHPPPSEGKNVGYNRVIRWDEIARPRFPPRLAHLSVINRTHRTQKLMKKSLPIMRSAFSPIVSRHHFRILNVEPHSAHRVLIACFLEVLVIRSAYSHLVSTLRVECPVRKVFRLFTACFMAGRI